MENSYEDPCGTSRLLHNAYPTGQTVTTRLAMSWVLLTVELWKHVKPLGKTPWTMEYQWSFNNLQNALEEGGPLHTRNVYLFSFPEPTFVLMNDEESRTCIPIITAVSSSWPPSQKVGYFCSLYAQRDEDIVDMRSCNLEWVPYTSPRAASSHGKPHIFILSHLESGRENINRLEEETGSYAPYLDKFTRDICPKEASEEQRIRVYKFYPDATNYSPIFPAKNKFINRYYGEADEVV